MPSCLVVITVKKHPSPTIWKGDKKTGYLSYPTNTPREEFIRLMAHELMHVVQEKKKQSYGPFRETQCDRYAIKKLEEWRKMYEKNRMGMKEFFKRKWIDVI